MGTKTRNSEQAMTVVRAFLLTALEHDAVSSAVDDLIFAHVSEGKYHPTTIPAKLHRVILDVLCQATPDDWSWVADVFTSQAREVLELEHPLNSTQEAQSPQPLTETRRVLRSLSPKQLRARAAKIYTHHRASLRAAFRGRKVTRTVDQPTGTRWEQIAASDQTRTCPNKAKAQTEREQVIEKARELDPETFDAETRDARPGKWERATDQPLAVALDIIDGHGLPDEIRGDAAVHGYAWRVKRFVGVVDEQGFGRSEEYQTLEEAIERLQDFAVPGDVDA